jgi:hypothetical protein
VLELSEGPESLRRRHVGPPRLVVPRPARVRRRHAPGQEKRAREQARGGGGGPGVLARRAGLQDAVMM